MDKYEEVKNLISHFHKNSLKVVFTHGVYDLFHKGHLKTLQESKKFGDILIVGIDSDILVKKLKGESRPIIADQDRAEIVRNIKCVDFSFIIAPSTEESKDLETYFVELYRYLAADIVTSGGDSGNGINHEKQCMSANIKYQKTSGPRIETTTSIIKRIQGN